MDRCITGPIRTRQNGLIETLTVTDSVLQGLPSEPGPALTALRDADGMFAALKHHRDPLSDWLASQLSAPSAAAVSGHADGDPVPAADQQLIVADLQTVIDGALVWSAARFAGRPLRTSTLAEAQAPPTGPALAALNRQLLAEAYPLALADAALAAEAGLVKLSRCTVLGPAYLHRLECSESILDDVVRVINAQDGCVRFSAWSAGSALPRRYESVQIAPRAPILVSRRYGEWGYAQVHDGADSAILSRHHRRAAEHPHRQPRRIRDGRLLPRRRRDQGPVAADQAPRIPPGRAQPRADAPARRGSPGRVDERQTMATDIARLSFDPARHYTGVAAQQGRVTLEAEQNEQRIIDAEERRLELIDIIGPAGTPDDGYAISAATGFDFTIGAGTMYVGGLRVVARRRHPLQQPARLARPRRRPGLDRARREDRPATSTSSWSSRNETSPPSKTLPCARPRSAAPTARPHLAAPARPAQAHRRRGLLQSAARRGARLGQPGAHLRPGHPAATLRIPAPGHLGRHRRTAEPVRADQHRRIPGRGEPADPGPGHRRRHGQGHLRPGLGLGQRLVPVPRHRRRQHQPGTHPRPQPGRRLPPAARRPGRAGAARRRRAAQHRHRGRGIRRGAARRGRRAHRAVRPGHQDRPVPGRPARLLHRPEADSRSCTCACGRNSSPANTIGTPITLTGTGLQVTISLDGPGPVHADDYWCIGVRPSTSTQVYPGRYLRTPQPPDGPRQWACPLAVISWPADQLAVLKDCRPHFRPLTAQP